MILRVYSEISGKERGYGGGVKVEDDDPLLSLCFWLDFLG